MWLKVGLIWGAPHKASLLLLSFRGTFLVNIIGIRNTWNPVAWDLFVSASNNWFGLALLFNGISTFLGYIIQNPSFEKNSSGTI